MSASVATIIQAIDAKFFTEGDEQCREYLREPRMWFGTSTLEPGQHGAIDPGHERSVEVFFCCSGRVRLNDGERDYELSPGVAAIIPEGLPHALTNVGDVPALLVWAGAPGGS
jgi:mannose-6-phosphate isomerase-like protein (cupin superfamily)